MLSESSEDSSEVSNCSPGSSCICSSQRAQATKLMIQRNWRKAHEPLAKSRRLSSSTELKFAVKWLVLFSVFGEFLRRLHNPFRRRKNFQV